MAAANFLLLAAAAAAGTVGPTPVYRDSSQPIPARVADLISRMTVDELIAQLIDKNEGSWVNIPQIEAEYGATGIGTLFIDEVMNKSWTSPIPWSTPLETVRARNNMQAYFLNNSRLGIPISFCEEALHSGAWGGTVFPGPPVLAQAFNTTMVQMVGAAIAVEARAAGVDTGLSPVVNMITDPRFGRWHEGLSADPLVTTLNAVAMVTGLQGGMSPNASTYLPSYNTSIVAQAKHFAAYGHPSGGLNGGVADITNRTLFETYLKPWRAMAAVGLRSFMVSHQTVNDVPCHANGWLINGVMRGTYGFGDGYTISDEMNIGHLAPWGWAVADNITQAAAYALTAGVDIDLQSGANVSTQAYSWLKQSLAEGQITVADLQTAVSHVLTMKFAAGLFEQPFTPEEGLSVLDSPAHRQLALEGARQGIVLAKNDDGVLPLQVGVGKLIKQIALIGPLLSCNFTAFEAGQEVANRRSYGSVDSGVSVRKLGATGKPVRDPTPNFCSAREAMVGAYALDNGAVPIPLLPESLDALLPPGVTTTVNQGAGVSSPELNLIPAAVQAARDADIAIVAVGDDQSTCAEGIDRSSLDLPGGQLQLLQALAFNTTVPIVVVLFNGRPATFGPSLGAPLLARISSLIIASNPGAMGGQALAEILLGITNPSGRLADSWAANVGHIGSSSQPFLALRNGEWTSGQLAADPDGRVFPAYEDDSWAPAVPLFPFLHGLSYTTFQYQSISVKVITPRTSLPADLNSPQALRAARSTVAVEASVNVCNTGPVDGNEVVAVYSRDPRGGSGGARLLTPYWKRLVGFMRIPLAAGQCGTATVPVLVDDLATHTADDAAQAHLVLRVLPGRYTFSTGPNSRMDNITTTLMM